MTHPYMHKCEKPSQRLREGLLFTCETCDQHWQYQGHSESGYWKAIISNRYANAKKEQIEELLGPAVTISDGDNEWIVLHPSTKLSLTPSDKWNGCIVGWLLANDDAGQQTAYIVQRLMNSPGIQTDSYHVAFISRHEGEGKLFQWNWQKMKWELAPDWENSLREAFYAIPYQDMRDYMNEEFNSFNHPAWTVVEYKINQ